MRIVRGVPSITPPPGLVFGLGLGLFVLVILTISPFALSTNGWNYGETGGTALEKMHPATLLAGFLLLAAACVRGNPLSGFVNAGLDHPGLAVYFAGIGLLIAHAILWAGLPFTTFIDTFVGPAIVFLLFDRLPDERGRTLARLIHILFFVNALVGVSEFVFGYRLTPMVIEGTDIDEDWRSSALLGHPLTNAALTGAYMVILAGGGGRDLPGFLRLVLMLVAAAGMVVFGGRAATAFVIFFLIVFGLRRIFSVLAGAKFNPRMMLPLLVGLPILFVLIGAAWEAGFFDQFLSRLIDDEGSANTRVEMFELFRHISAYDLVFGPDQQQISTLAGIYGLEFGIESFWVAMILQHGFIVAIVFFLTLFFFCREVVLATARGSLAAFVYFFAVASTSVSLSAKSPSFAIFLVLVMVLLRRAPSAEATADTAPALPFLDRALRAEHGV